MLRICSKPNGLHSNLSAYKRLYFIWKTTAGQVKSGLPTQALSFGFLPYIHTEWVQNYEVKASELKSALHFSPGYNPSWKWNQDYKANDYENTHVLSLNLYQWISHFIKIAFHLGPSESLANLLAFKLPIKIMPWSWNFWHCFLL